MSDENLKYLLPVRRLKIDLDEASWDWEVVDASAPGYPDKLDPPPSGTYLYCRDVVDMLAWFSDELERVGRFDSHHTMVNLNNLAINFAALDTWDPEEHPHP